jgi:diguanylate cyclase (GGDEF)-like protein
MKLLVIDHDLPVLEELAQLLGDLAELDTAKGGVAGLAATAGILPDLIVCDAAMPDIDGVSFCRHLQSDILTRHIPVLLCVASSLGDDGELDALRAGAVDVIKKPISPLLVRARVSIQIEMCRNSERLLDLSRRDPLTGIFNRRYFDDRLRDEWARHQRNREPLGVAMVDIDFFKSFNDHYGHVKGDECLMTVADKLRQATRRPGELVARYGGEEFVLLLPATAFAAADVFGRILCDEMRALRYPHAGADSGFLSVSVGLATTIPRDTIRPNELVRCADEALYAAKRSGRNRHVVHCADGAQLMAPAPP